MLRDSFEHLGIKAQRFWWEFAAVGEISVGDYKTEIMGVSTVMNEMKHPNVSGKMTRSFRPSSSSNIINNSVTEWPISDVSSDLTIEVGTATFALHKFPLISRCGRIRKLLSDPKDTKISRLHLQSVPGGSKSFEIAAKFCYGINPDITLSNIAMLHCISHFLEMTDEYANNNLLTRTQSYLNDIVLPNISNSIHVLHSTETLLPLSEHINLVNTLITCIADNACKQQLSSGLSKLQHNFPKPTPLETQTPSDWWGMSLPVLCLDFFHRVLSAMKTMGLKQDIITTIIVNYANTSLQPLIPHPDHIDFEQLQNKQRVIVERITSLLPTPSRKSSVPMGFLSSLLKCGISSSVSTSCKADLERRIGLQLDQAILEDILIPVVVTSVQNSHCSMYDTDTILRIFSIFLNLDDDDDDEDTNIHQIIRDESEMIYDFDTPCSPKQSSILKVSNLLDTYLAEVSLDSNLSTSNFIALAELLPDHARIQTDGLYRAIDIFLKVHPNINETERYRLCKTIDCQKLSQEACTHAAQNERLPVQMAVQVLYFEQTRLRNAMNGGGAGGGSHNHNHFFFGSLNQRTSSGAGSGTISPRDNYASVRRENRELKLEVARMRMRLTDLEKDHVSMKQELVRTHPANKMFKSFTKKLCKLNALFRISSVKPLGSRRANSESRFFFQRRKHHSVS